MIHEFLESWALFHDMYLTGSLIAVLLSMIGVLVVARDQIFLGATVSQASTLGIALAMWLGTLAGSRLEWLESEFFVSAMAVLFCILAALFTWHGGKPKKESYEAATGWVFLLSASISILIVSKSPLGLEEVHRLFSSTIIGSTRSDVVVFALLLPATIFLFCLTRQNILLLAIDPQMAASVGMRRKVWELFISLWLGISVGLSIRSSGMLYTFGCLVLPALTAKNLCREVGSMFYAAPLIALVINGFAFMLANYYDYPPAQVSVALLCLTLGFAWFRPGLFKKYPDGITETGLH